VGGNYVLLEVDVWVCRAHSPFTKVNFGLLSHCLMFCRVPAVRLSKTQTLAPLVRRASTRWLPMKPAAPVTKTFFISIGCLS